MCQLMVMVVPLFTVVLDPNVPTHNIGHATVYSFVGSKCATHNNGRAVAQCCVPDGCHCNNGNTEIHT